MRLSVFKKVELLKRFIHGYVLMECIASTAISWDETSHQTQGLLQNESTRTKG